MLNEKESSPNPAIDFMADKHEFARKQFMDCFDADALAKVFGYKMASVILVQMDRDAKTLELSENPQKAIDIPNKVIQVLQDAGMSREEIMFGITVTTITALIGASRIMDGLTKIR